MAQHDAPHSSFIHQPAILAQQASIRLGKRLIWQDADFTISAGEFITIIGPNGAGKSTLLRVLLGLLALSSGTVTVLGQAPRRGNAFIGYVPQRRTLDANLRVRAFDFVALGLDGHRWGIPIPFHARRRRQQTVHEALAAVGATTYAYRPVGKLSGGEQQRLLLAQALLVQPKILLLDEPLASLDMRNQAAMAREVAQVARARGITVLLVSHDVNPLLPFTDRVLYVAQQRIALGAADEIITSEHLSQLYDAPIEVVRDSHGRVLVFGQEEQSADYALTY